MKAKLRELEEFRAVFAGRSNLVDSVIPPIIFLVVNPPLGFDYAVWGSLLISLLVSLFRLSRGQSLKYALGGLGGVILAILAAKLLNRAEAYFLPGVITGILTAVICGGMPPNNRMNPTGPIGPRSIGASACVVGLVVK